MNTAALALPVVSAAAKSPEWNRPKRLDVLLLHLAIALLGTVNTGKGVFFPKLVEAFGLSHAAGAALISISSLTGGVLAFVAGWLMLGRLSARWVIVVVPIFSGAGFLVVSFADSYGQLVAGYLLTSGTLLNQVAIAFLLTSWFRMGRGLALALVYAGTTTGGVLFTPLLSYVVDQWDWRVGYRSLAAAVLVLPLLLNWMLRHNPQAQAPRSREGLQPLPGLTVPQALATRSFWLIVFANFIFGANTGTYFVHFITLLESTGYSSSKAAWTMSQLFLLAALAKIIFGYAGDRVDIRWSLAVALAMSAGGWWLLQRFDASQTALYGFTLIFGLSYSGPLVLFPLLASVVFGRRSFSLIDAVITVVGLSIGGAVGPVLAGWIYDSTGSYRLLFPLLSASLVAAAIAALLARPKEYVDELEGRTHRARTELG